MPKNTTATTIIKPTLNMLCVCPDELYNTSLRLIGVRSVIVVLLRPNFIYIGLVWMVHVVEHLTTVTEVLNSNLTGAGLNFLYLQKGAVLRQSLKSKSVALELARSGTRKKALMWQIA